MRVQDVMTQKVECCTPSTDLADAAMRMWRSECGILPIVEEETRKLLGVVTDRDICMAASTQHQPPCQIQVGSLMKTTLRTCTPKEDVHAALKTMSHFQVRRLPVVGPDGRLEGMLSINDLILNTARNRTGDRHPIDLGTDDVMATMRAICAHTHIAEPGQEPEIKDLAGKPAHDLVDARELMKVPF